MAVVPFCGVAEEPDGFRGRQRLQRTANGLESGCHGGDESVIPNQIPRFILQDVENRCQLCQRAGPVGRLA